MRESEHTLKVLCETHTLLYEHIFQFYQHEVPTWNFHVSRNQGGYRDLSPPLFILLGGNTTQTTFNLLIPDTNKFHQLAVTRVLIMLINQT